jgi:ABC-type polysaccharide/polyol phosphate export permease
MSLVTRELLRSAALWRIWLRLGVQDVRLRFRRSAIGAGWIFLNLAITILAIGFIYSSLFGQDLGTFIPRLTIGLITWSYLTSSIVEGGTAFVGSEGYIKQISLPLYVYVFRRFTSIGLTTLISLLAFVVVVLLYEVPVSVGTLWVLPGLLLTMVSSLGLTFIFAHLNARFRDAAHLASIVMQILFYVTPVIYPVELIRQRQLGWVVDLNPLYHLLEVVRHPLLTGDPASGLSYLVVGGIVLVLSMIALVLARHYQQRIVYFL